MLQDLLQHLGINLMPKAIFWCMHLRSEIYCVYMYIHINILIPTIIEKMQSLLSP